jgi:hypothetical protein
MLAETNDVEGDAVMQDAHEDGVWTRHYRGRRTKSLIWCRWVEILNTQNCLIKEL